MRGNGVRDTEGMTVQIRKEVALCTLMCFHSLYWTPFKCYLIQTAACEFGNICSILQVKEVRLLEIKECGQSHSWLVTEQASN